MKVEFKKNKIHILIFSIFIAIWMAGVFFFSNQGSTTSLQLSGTVIDVIKRNSTQQDIQIQNQKGTNQEVQAIDNKHTKTQQKIVRKAAHFSIYVVGGAIVYIFLNLISEKMKYKKMIAWGIGTAYAITDEIHQYFVPGRTALVTDVMIDSFGILCGVLFVAGIVYMIKRRKKGE